MYFVDSQGNKIQQTPKYIEVIPKNVNNIQTQSVPKNNQSTQNKKQLSL